MGSPKEEVSRGNDEGPVRVVEFSRAFAVGKTEVTVGDWRLCMSEGGCNELGGGLDGVQDDQPVVNVAWEETQQFAA